MSGDCIPQLQIAHGNLLNFYVAVLRYCLLHIFIISLFFSSFPCLGRMHVPAKNDRRTGNRFSCAKKPPVAQRLLQGILPRKHARLFRLRNGRGQTNPFQEYLSVLIQAFYRYPPEDSRELRVPPFSGLSPQISLLQAIIVYYRASREKANIRVLAVTALYWRKKLR